MAAELYPTKTRLALLQAVADGEITERYPMLPGLLPWAQWDLGPSAGQHLRYRKVTSRVEELYRAGWIFLGDRIDDRSNASCLFTVTEAGRAVLEERTNT